MLDEPLGSLDRALREELMTELRRILLRVGVTTLYVTHDQQEAFAMADRVLIMNQGQIIRQGTPEEVYRQPASSWAARFLGLTNLVPGRVAATLPPVIETPLGDFPVAPEGSLSAGQGCCYEIGRRVTLLIRPEAARLASDCPGESALRLEGQVVESAFRGGHYSLVVRHASGEVLTFQVVPGANALPRAGEKVSLVLRAEAIGVLEETQ
jgi:ABC-type Fe3+/spermidine/putrescine transport system ATPase subunit